MTIPPNPHPEQVEITQEDRQAAVNYLYGYAPELFADNRKWMLRGGHDNHKTVQAFARHRLASRANRPADDGELERLALRAIKAVTATAKDGAAGLSRIMSIARSAGVEEQYTELLTDTDVALIVERPRREWAHLFKPGVEGCAIPPAGWKCTRARGHSGPCAAVPMPPQPEGVKRP